MIAIDKIEAMLMDKDTTIYWIASRADLPYTTVVRYRNGGSMIDNMTVGTAKKLGGVVNEWEALRD